MKANRIRLILHPLAWFVSFNVFVLGGVFITGEIDPMQWEKHERGAVLFLWLMTAGLGLPLLIELAEVPKALAEQSE
jgi:hypothetical protein